VRVAGRPELLRRHPRLRGLSSDHHRALILARTLRTQGAEPGQGTELLRLVRREFDRDLAPHFRIEETQLLPALERAGRSDLARRTRQEHAELRQHLRDAESAVDPTPSLLRFAEILVAHVRFDERLLFPACELLLDPEVLQRVAAVAPPPGVR